MCVSVYVCMCILYVGICVCVFPFVADVVLVLDNERLLIQLQNDLPSEANILPLPKSAGVSCISTHK